MRVEQLNFTECFNVFSAISIQQVLKIFSAWVLLTTHFYGSVLNTNRFQSAHSF